MTALIFDMDGVLVETIELHFAAWRQIAVQVGKSLGPDALEDLRGLRRDDCLRRIFAPDELSLHDLATYSAVKDDLYLTALHEMNPESLITPGTSAFLEHARQNGCRLGVASSSVNTFTVLEHTRLLDYFDVVADGRTVVRSKPHPDVFLWVAGALGVPAHKTIIFEDAQAGIAAAEAIGAFVVGIGNGKAARKAAWYAPDLVDIDLQLLIEQVQNRDTALPIMSQSKSANGTQYQNQRR
ncbi:MAG: beta-phosphoglucomutase family hydrolase [Anaerolineae bacterium]|nr:beta-phosphoglucomutase family hydrolase [Anaerolineae bacterium]MCA9895134.1 beta-phosphoglucomutase family hydrolase [Anaerolineae bacterium]